MARGASRHCQTEQMTASIILAAGRGERMGAGTAKAFLRLGRRMVVEYSLLAFEACPDIDAIVLAAPAEMLDCSRALCESLGITKLAAIVAGGVARQDSVLSGLAAIPDGTDIVAIHDAARALVTPELISATISSAREFGSGVAACKVVDTIKAADDDMCVESTIDRSRLWAVATPQTFNMSLIRAAYDKVAKSGVSVTDDAGALEATGRAAKLVAWKGPNFKITYPEDLEMARLVLATRETNGGAL